MPENTCLYTSVDAPLTVEEIQDLIDGEATALQAADGSIVVTWPDVEVSLSTMAEPQIPDHIKGFMGYVVHMSGGEVDDNIEGLLGFLGAVQCVIGCEIRPGFDDEGKAKSLIVSMACTYEHCLMFANDNIYSPFGQLLFGPEGEADYADLSAITVRKTRVDPVETTERQQKRTARVRGILADRDVPDFAGHIRWIPDDEQIELRSSQEVARRVIAMHGVVCCARGRDREDVLDELQAAGVMKDLSPEEAAFLQQQQPNPSEAQQLIWRLECLWVLMWALGYIKQFDWPDHMCDVDGQHERIFDATESTERFIASAKLRGRATILNAVEMITRIHWAIRQSMVEEKPIPQNLNWKQPSEFVSVFECPSVGVVAERHRALNWLICFGGASWDDVDTPT